MFLLLANNFCCCCLTSVSPPKSLRSPCTLQGRCVCVCADFAGFVLSKWKMFSGRVPKNGRNSVPWVWLLFPHIPARHRCSRPCNCFYHDLYVYGGSHNWGYPQMDDLFYKGKFHLNMDETFIPFTMWLTCTTAMILSDMAMNPNPGTLPFTWKSL